MLWKREKERVVLLNLRFKWVVLSSFFYVMYAVPKAEYMLRHPEKYTEMSIIDKITANNFDNFIVFSPLRKIS